MKWIRKFHSLPGPVHRQGDMVCHGKEDPFVNLSEHGFRFLNNPRRCLDKHRIDAVYLRKERCPLLYQLISFTVRSLQFRNTLPHLSAEACAFPQKNDLLPGVLIISQDAIIIQYFDNPVHNSPCKICASPSTGFFMKRSVFLLSSADFLHYT